MGSVTPSVLWNQTTFSKKTNKQTNKIKPTNQPTNQPTSKQTNKKQPKTKKQNKAVLEPRVTPAFAITYFCNHCNIRLEITSKYVDTVTTFFFKNLNQRSLTPR